MATIEELKEIAARYSNKTEFKIGDVVRWKDGLRDRRYPAYGEPAIVMGLHPGEIDDERSTGTPYYGAPIDLSVGVIDRDGEFGIYRAESQRFEIYE